MKEEFSIVYESVTFSVAEDRKTASIEYEDYREIKLSSGSMYMLCKSIVDLIEAETVAFDYFGQEIIIK